MLVNFGFSKTKFYDYALYISQHGVRLRTVFYRLGVRLCAVLVSCESHISRISPQKRIFQQSHFSLFIRVPGGLDSYSRIKRCQKSRDTATIRSVFFWLTSISWSQKDENGRFSLILSKIFEFNGNDRGTGRVRKSRVTSPLTLFTYSLSLSLGVISASQHAWKCTV